MKKVPKKVTLFLQLLVLILGIVLIAILVEGCSKDTKIETPPWNDQQIERMENENINSTPFLRIKV